ncbi:Solitary outer membrane autotransporter beta-barrel domain [Shewanella gaetbuli]|uniref:Solitary outer membrane autotransporter beta-barrel domain n=1 Tax=Shewanella gaetbuli TaxID=220752 RepID=A0A9X1ZNH7_9GAMM|nr:Solitary outer membrane autotransporter beta-barrel domain [Shewanella gaetbuli]MCL1142720.1 Solitary outer membrane autotransporter beta-barrel domain [Shewanella gaetbuli]
MKYSVGCAGRGLLCCLAVFSVSGEESNVDQFAGNFAKSNITSAMVLADGNLVTLGVVNFNPNTVLGINRPEFGDSVSLQRRKKLSVYSLPYTTDWSKKSDWQTAMSARISYVASHDDLALSGDGSALNDFDEQSYLAKFEYLWRYSINNQWTYKMGVGGQFVDYHNRLDFDAQEYPLLSDEVDGIVFNTAYRALMFDPSVELHFVDMFWGHKWQFVSRINYGTGKMIEYDNALQNVSPEVLRFSNSVIFHYEFPSVWQRYNELRLLMKRVDIHGDAVDAFETNHYYEAGLGWLVDTSNDLPMLDNIGLGVTVNFGSALSGGSVVLLFNEEI